MNILYVVDRFPVFSETFISDEVAEHLNAGANILLAVLQGEASGDYPLKDNPLHGRLSIQYVGYNPDSAVSKFGLIGKTFAGGLLSYAKYRELAALGLSAREIAQAALLVRSSASIDIIHCHFGNIGRVGLALKKLLDDKPKLFVTFHAHDLLKQWYLPLSQYYRPLFASEAILLPISERWRELLISKGAEPSRVHVHHAGVSTQKDSDTTEANQEPAKDDKAPLEIVMIGRLVEKKGHRYAIEALSQVKDQLSFHCSIIGGGPLRHKIAEQILALGLSDHVTMHGSLMHDVTLNKLNEADVLLLPSVTSVEGDMEGIPVVLMEAMALGTPVLSTRHSGIPELVEDGISGLLADERDTKGLADNLLRIGKDAQLRTRLGKAGREKVVAEFNRDTLGTQLRERYRTSDGQIEQSAI